MWTYKTKWTIVAVLAYSCTRIVFMTGLARPLDQLKEREIFWRDRYDFFKSHGYLLRPRYHPEWQPSWRSKVDSNPLLEFIEDSIVQWKGALLDATDDRNGKDVFIKRVDSRTHPNEVGIALRLGSSKSRSDSRNHCVPILDVLQDARDSNYQYIVMPVFRPFNAPNFTTFGEVVDFVKQTLEGLAYMHAQNVAHRDCAAENILMDGSNLFKNGWHPMNPWLSRDGTKFVSLSRNWSEVQIRYYFIDFGLSTQFVPGQRERLVTGELGRIQAPEQLTGRPYDPFKLDVYVLGTVYQTRIVDKLKGLDRLRELAQLMTKPDPKERPTPVEAQMFWDGILLVPNLPARWTRLRSTEEEGQIERIVNGALEVVGMVRGSIGL